MARFEVTKELSDALKTLRIENNIPSKEVAAHLNKSASFISKLEKGELKTVEVDELLEVLRYITNNQYEQDEAITELFRTLSVKYKASEIKEMLFASNFDEVYRAIPIPETLVRDVNERMSSLGMSVDYLVYRINSNESIPVGTENLEHYPTNLFAIYKLPNGKKGQFIKLQVDKSVIESILARKTTSTNHITLRAIVFYLIKAELYGEKTELDSSELQIVTEKARVYLEQYQIYSLHRKAEIMQELTNKKELEMKLSKHDIENIMVSENIYSLIDLYSQFDIETANKELSSLVENMKWDAPLIMRIAGLDFRKLGDCSYRIKKQMLDEIEAVLEKYCKMPMSVKTMEQY